LAAACNNWSSFRWSEPWKWFYLKFCLLFRSVENANTLCTLLLEKLQVWLMNTKEEQCTVVKGLTALFF